MYWIESYLDLNFLLFIYPKHRINSVYRDKSFSSGFNGNLADASALEEKLEVKFNFTKKKILSTGKN